ncbi:hypothetical protein EC973_003329 [Apophysomyces ossiformis]|uniref:Uncharacterized protein n=1 Tax=Apophysomyces ossiformis TaxID=679940 RepID=A0A8H7ETF1_9FUNG|nr:hypothetical protein EC973_003329 [Apophysomyces ossiformis]
MDPNQCSVLIVNSEGSSDTSLSSLYSVFADVTTAKIGDDAIEKLQARQIHSVLSTLVLIDIENHTHNDDGLQFLKTIVQKLETGLLVDTVPVGK